MYMKFVEIICDVDRKKASDAGSTGAEYVLAILSMMSDHVREEGGQPSTSLMLNSCARLLSMSGAKRTTCKRPE